MNRILVDGEEKEFIKESLPILIHGEEGSGASLYTVSLVANFYQQGFPVLFLCGFSMAEEEFAKQVGKEYGDKARFFTQEKVEVFKKILASENTNHVVIVIKNIELFAEDVFDLVSEKQNLIISGDVNKSGIKNKILEEKFTTQIYFSPFESIELPALNKYEGFVIGGDYKGISSLA
jgi:hypothetical protein